MFKKNLAQMCVIVRNIDLTMRICYDFSTAVSKKMQFLSKNLKILIQKNGAEFLQKICKLKGEGNEEKTDFKYSA